MPSSYVHIWTLLGTAAPHCLMLQDLLWFHAFSNDIISILRNRDNREPSSVRTSEVSMTRTPHTPWWDPFTAACAAIVATASTISSAVTLSSSSSAAKSLSRNAFLLNAHCPSLGPGWLQSVYSEKGVNNAQIAARGLLHSIEWVIGCTGAGEREDGALEQWSVSRMLQACRPGIAMRHSIAAAVSKQTLGTWLHIVGRLVIGNVYEWGLLLRGGRESVFRHIQKFKSHWTSFTLWDSNPCQNGIQHFFKMLLLILDHQNIPRSVWFETSFLNTLNNNKQRCELCW